MLFLESDDSQTALLNELGHCFPLSNQINDLILPATTNKSFQKLIALFTTKCARVYPKWGPDWVAAIPDKEQFIIYISFNIESICL